MKYFESSLRQTIPKIKILGRGGGIMVHILAFYFDDRNSNPTGYWQLIFCTLLLQKDENKLNEAGNSQFKKKIKNQRL